jgi:hypothetical protein
MMFSRPYGLPLLLLLLGSGRLPAAPLHTEEKGTYLGALFAPVPEALYDHLPQLPRNQGVLITHILPDSPAAHGDLRRHDILYQYDDTPIRNCAHFVRLIRDDTPGRTVRLLLLRGGQQTKGIVVLTEGPALKIAPDGPSVAQVPSRVTLPSVSVAAVPLTGGQMKVTIAYPKGQSGQLNKFTCQGASAEIDSAVEKLPARERDLVRAALQRIRELNSTRKN